MKFIYSILIWVFIYYNSVLEKRLSQKESSLTSMKGSLTDQLGGINEVLNQCYSKYDYEYISNKTIIYQQDSIYNTTSNNVSISKDINMNKKNFAENENEFYNENDLNSMNNTHDNDYLIEYDKLNDMHFETPNYRKLSKKEEGIK